jgi:8-oxoguanine DNA glycosylase, N-terminal domain
MRVELVDADRMQPFCAAVPSNSLVWLVDLYRNSCVPVPALTVLNYDYCTSAHRSSANLLPFACAQRLPSLCVCACCLHRCTQPLAALYALWSSADARLAAIGAALPGVRVLRQDPIECLVSCKTKRVCATAMLCTTLHIEACAIYTALQSTSVQDWSDAIGWQRPRSGWHVTTASGHCTVISCRCIALHCFMHCFRC